MMPSEPTDSTAPTRPRGFFDDRDNVERASGVALGCTFFLSAATLTLFAVHATLRGEANNAPRPKRVAEYNQVVTEWIDTHLPGYQAMFTGANAIPIPTVSVSRGVGANPSATGGILSSATGGALVIETDTSEAVPGLPDPENDYLRYSSGLVLTTRVSRFHDSRWQTEEWTNITVGDGDFAVVFPVVSYYCSVYDRNPYSENSDATPSVIEMIPHYLTKITLFVDDVRSDGHFVADAALSRCSLEYSTLSASTSHGYQGSTADAWDRAWSDCWTGGYPSGGTPDQDGDLEIVIRHPRDPYVRAVDIANNGCGWRTFGIDGEALKKQANAVLFFGAIPSLVVFLISAVSSFKLYKRYKELLPKEEEKQVQLYFLPSS